MSDFATRFAVRLGVSRDTATRVLSTLSAEAREALHDGTEVRLPGLGAIYAAKQPAREHVDRFRLGQGVRVVRKIPPRLTPRFRASRYLRNFLQGEDHRKLSERERGHRQPPGVLELDSVAGIDLSRCLWSRVILYHGRKRLEGSWEVHFRDPHVVFLRSCGRCIIEHVAVLAITEGWCYTIEGSSYRWRKYGSSR